MLTLAWRRPVAVALVPLLVTSLVLGPGPKTLAAGGPQPSATRERGPDATALAVLVVPAPDVTSTAAATLRHQLASRLAAGGTPVAAGHEPPPPDPAMLDALRGALAAGLAAYESLDPTTARDRFEAVAAALEADGRLVDAAPDLLDAPVYLALVGLGLGDQRGADLAFQRAIRLAPARPLRPGRFSPAAEEAYALARIRLATLRPSVLRLAAAPEGVDLYVDGVYRGRTPLAIEPLAPGPHLLFAQAPGLGAVTRQLQTTDLGPDILTLTVPAGPAATSLVTLAAGLETAETPAPFPPAEARGLAGTLGATRLLLVWLEGTRQGFRAAAGLVDLDTGAWLARDALGEAAEAAVLGTRVADWFDTVPRADRAVAAGPPLLSDWRAPSAVAPDSTGGTGQGAAAPVGLAPAPAVLGLPSATGARDRGPGRPWYRRWYVWLLVGAGLAAGAAAAAVVGSGGGGGSSGAGSVSVAPGN